MMKTHKPIPFTEPEIDAREVALCTEALETRWVSGAGKYVSNFEAMFRGFTGAQSAVATCNGTMGIFLALWMHDIGPGDEVIVPTLSFIATVNPVKYVRAEPVFVDVEPGSMNMDPTKIEEMITPRTKAIMPVHLYGHPVDMDPILDIAEKHNLLIIEDATNSLGAVYKGKRAGTANAHPGTMGRMGVFSFNANKMITTGSGGMVVTMDEELGARAKRLTAQARDGGFEYFHPEVGFNMRLPDPLAAIGIAQMERLPHFIESKRKFARIYSELLNGVPGIAPARQMPWAESCWWVFTMFIDPVEFGADRNDVIAALDEHKISCRPLFIPNHTLPPYKDCRHGEITVAPRLWETGLQLPVPISLSESDQEYIVDVIKGIPSKKKGSQ